VSLANHVARQDKAGSSNSSPALTSACLTYSIEKYEEVKLEYERWLDVSRQKSAYEMGNDDNVC